MSNILNIDYYLTDGGFETELVFKHGFDLPEFAAFPLVNDPLASEKIAAYYRTFLDVAAESGAGFVLETPTWRASRKWGARLGFDAEGLKKVNERSVAMMKSLRDEYQGKVSDVVVSGNVGPQDDGYSPDVILTADQAEEYHSEQISWFKDAGVDVVTAITICYSDEAIGFVKAAKKLGVDSIISFTVETDGTLPNGENVGEAIRRVDEETEGGPAYYMINCAHPTHFDNVIDDPACLERIRGVRGNASRMSHEELDNAEELDQGDPVDFAHVTLDLRKKHEGLRVFGGCCGTDHRHIAEVAKTL